MLKKTAVQMNATKPRKQTSDIITIAGDDIVSLGQLMGQTNAITKGDVIRLRGIQS